MGWFFQISLVQVVIIIMRFDLGNCEGFQIWKYAIMPVKLILFQSLPIIIEGIFFFKKHMLSQISVWR